MKAALIHGLGVRYRVANITPTGMASFLPGHIDEFRYCPLAAREMEIRFEFAWALGATLRIPLLHFLGAPPRPRTI